MLSLLNPVPWIVLGAIVALLARSRPGLQRYGRVLAHPAVAALVSVAAIGHVVARLAIGLLAPGDYAGEVVAAHAWHAGAPIYSSNVAADSRDVVGAPPDPLAGAIDRMLPARVRAAIDARRHTRLVAQAHPPTLVTAWLALMALLGTSGAFLVVGCASAATAAWMGWSLARRCGCAELAWAAAATMAAWQPVLAAVRDGQVGVLLASVAFLASMRPPGSVAAGGLGGLAAAAKVYPALLLAPLCGRSFRAWMSAALVVALAVACSVLVCGLDAWPAFGSAAASAVDGHWRSWASVSLLARFGAVLPKQPAVAAWIVCGVFLVGVTAWADWRRGPRADLSFAAYACLAVVLSPVAWHHYTPLLAVSLACAAREAWRRDRRGGVLLSLGTALTLSLPVTETTHVWQPALACARTASILLLWGWLVRAPAIDERPSW